METACRNQTCSGEAYSLDVATAGLDVPYAVTSTTTGDATSTSFVFVLCSQALALGGCKPSDPGCSPVASFQLRTRDDMLEVGLAPTASPAGTPWAACYPSGPGYKWEGAALGELATPAATANDTCASFTVVTAPPAPGMFASLADVCQQNVTVADSKSGAVAVDTTGAYGSCVYTLTLASGRSAYGVLGMPMMLDDALLTAVAPAPAVDVSLPAAYARSGPTAYGAAGRRRRLAAANRRAGRLF